jgi:Alginate export
MGKIYNFKRLAFGILILCGTKEANAQFSLTGQVRTRTEIRNGLGNLLPADAPGAAFTSQRTRLTFGYKWDRVTFGAAVQDIRVWGQDASSITNNDGARLMLHEGWADITLANKADTTLKFRLVDQLSLKIGRQELLYDDVRLIGNLDWLQQGRRFDMALLKAMHHGWQIDLGYAFNQNTDAFNVANTNYVPGNLPLYVKDSKGVLVPTPAGIVPLAVGGNAANNSAKAGTPIFSNPPSTNGANQDYKAFQSLYISRKFGQTKFSGLFFRDEFGKYRLDSVGTTNGAFVYGRRFDLPETNARLTYGLMVNHTIGNASGFGKVAIQGAYYFQKGKSRDGQDLDASHYTISATYQKGNLAISPGIDYLSGNDAVNPSGKDNRFDPLYGTPHKHWGYMDFFYVGTGAAAGGLQNIYLKTKYILNNNIYFMADYHNFALASPMKKGDGSVIDNQLGTEIDLIASIQLNKFTNIELGYSRMFATESLSIAKAQAAATNWDRNGNWFYAMLNIRPDFFYAKPVAIKQ